MPKDIKLYTVFVASPSDVKDERDSLITVIDEINKSTGKLLSIKLELVRWETDTYPGFSDYPQDVINDQIKEYDIFIGIMWTKYGSPVKEYKSGTVEEFEIAYEKYIKDKDSVSILFYFKEGSMELGKLNLEEYNKVLRFKDEMSDLGGLYKVFNSTEGFATLVRTNLNSLLHDKVKVSSLNEHDIPIETAIAPFSEKENNEEEAKEEEISDEEELGYFELREVFDDSFNTTSEVLKNITSYTLDLKGKIEKSTHEMISIKKSPEYAKMKRGKIILDNLSKDLTDFTNRVETEIPIFKESIEIGIDAYSNALVIMKSFESEENINLIKEGIKQLIEAFESTIPQVSGFSNSLNIFPPMTTKIIKSKRKASKILSKFVDEMKYAKDLLEQTPD